MLSAQVIWQNYVRVVETWWDEYRDYFYATRPETMEIPYGDISEQVILLYTKYIVFFKCFSKPGFTKVVNIFFRGDFDYHWAWISKANNVNGQLNSKGAVVF